MITYRDQMRAVQAAMGMIGDEQDGIPGPKTDAAFATLKDSVRTELKSGTLAGGRLLVGGPGWKYSAVIVGDDICLYGVTATWFGGPNDPLDNGQTSSGVSTIPAGTMGCALALVADHPSTKGSPIAFPGNGKLKPGIPWKTPVEFKYGARAITVPVIDNGPARSAGDASDLTQAAFIALCGPGDSLKTGVLKGVTIRIIGAAKYAPALA